MNTIMTRQTALTSSVIQGQDHLERDKTRRIEQLDGWLESGLIDKKEYNDLKDRYEHDK